MSEPELAGAEQVARIHLLAHESGLDRAAVDRFARRRYRAAVEEISREDADAFVETLRSLSRLGVVVRALREMRERVPTPEDR